MAFENADEAEKMGYRMHQKRMHSKEMPENRMPMDNNMMGKKMMIIGCMDKMMQCMNQMQSAEMML